MNSYKTNRSGNCSGHYNHETKMTIDKMNNTNQTKNGRRTQDTPEGQEVPAPFMAPVMLKIW